MAAKFEIRQPKAGEFNWVLLSQGRTLATGESYTRKVSAVNAIESLRKAAASATVDDTTVKAPAKPAVAKAARATGKAVGKASGAVAKAEKTAKRAARTVETVTKKAVTAAKPARTAKTSAAPRGRARKA